MRGVNGILRLIDGLLRGDPTAVYVLVFAVVGTILILVAVEIIRRRRGI